MLSRKGICPIGYTGDICETVLDPCAIFSCKNNASCIGNKETQEVACICPIGYSGVHCENGL